MYRLEYYSKFYSSDFIKYRLSSTEARIWNFSSTSRILLGTNIEKTRVLLKYIEYYSSTVGLSKYPPSPLPSALCGMGVWGSRGGCDGWGWSALWSSSPIFPGRFRISVHKIAFFARGRSPPNPPSWGAVAPQIPHVLGRFAAASATPRYTLLYNSYTRVLLEYTRHKFRISQVQVKYLRSANFRFTSTKSSITWHI